MDDGSTVSVIFIMIIIFLWCIIPGCVRENAYLNEIKYLKEESVKRNKAHWETDTAGNVTWHWNEN